MILPQDSVAPRVDSANRHPCCVIVVKMDWVIQEALREELHVQLFGHDLQRWLIIYKALAVVAPLALLNDILLAKRLSLA